MVNSENGKIGCSAGRAKIVDPNDFDGFKSTDNVPVQQEDLNISVILKSFRKGRTLLTTDSAGGTNDTIGQIQVNFIEGSDIGSADGKKVLTTKYTDLTTSFDKGTINDETLGITNIDIEFNPSMAPMVTINFIDVRGSSIFQNEENILNNRGNKYTTFFQLPYPMFELEVKGYYGMPVKYCLHMLKFNSKFNSKTGNFEITCNFIGYTFALMSDMLLGYLKAIPFTKIGGEQFEAYNATISGDKKVNTLSQLSADIRDINKGIAKTANENPAAKDLNTVSSAIEQLDNIKGQINILGQHFDLNKQKEEYTYIVYVHKDKFSTSDENALNNLYKVEVKKAIEEYLKLTTIEPLVEADFVNVDTTTNTTGGKLYQKITIKQLKADDDPTLKLNMGNPSNFLDIKDKLLKHINTFNNDTPIGDDALIDVFDMSLLFEKLSKSKKAMEGKESSSKIELAKAFEAEVRSKLGFDPTARRIIEHFTAAIEVFIETIFRVSQAASINTDRTEELAKKFVPSTSPNSLDTDMKNVYIELQQFFPWPDYREQQSVSSNGTDMDTSAQNQPYVEKYLGAAGVLGSPEKVDELVFIDDLLQAFRKAAQADQDAAAEEAKDETTWYPSNPLETKIFIGTEPYERAQLGQAEDVARLAMIRAMTFLGYSSDPDVMSVAEATAFAAAEVDAMLRGVKDDVLKQSLTQLNETFFLGIEGTINTVTRPVVVEDGDNYKYNYIYKDAASKLKVIPLNKGFGGQTTEEGKKDDFWGDPKDTDDFRQTLIDKRDAENFFLTNYSDANKYKPDDGGIYVKIIDMEAMPTPVSLISQPEGLTTESVILFDKIQLEKVDSTAGYNSFGGDYGIQEFKTMDWGTIDELKGLPLRFVFYRNCDIGLAYTRESSAKIQSVPDGNIPTSPQMFKINSEDKVVNQQIYWPNSKEEAYKSVSGNYYVHSGLGYNRKLFNVLLNGGGSDKVTYPYVELKYGEPNGTFTIDKEPRKAYEANSFSLFGSEFYYNQSYAKIYKKDGTAVPCSDYSKAFLYLQSLPFNMGQSDGNPFNKWTIKHLFDKKAGIVHAPRLWCAWVGSILWRMDENYPITNSEGKITGGGVGKYVKNDNVIKSGEPIVWAVDYTNGKINDWNSFYDSQTLFRVPDQDQYFPFFLDYTKGTGDGETFEYINIKDTDTIKTLPRQVKVEFKKIFFDFVNGTGGKISWNDLANKLEIYDTTSDTSGKGFYYYLKAVRGLDANTSNGDGTSTEAMITGKINGTKYKTNEENIKKYYDVITPIDKSFNDFYLFLELKDGYTDNEAVKSIIDSMTEEVCIINTNYKIWGGGKETTEFSPITVNKELLKAYFVELTTRLKDKADEYNIAKKNEQLDISVFGTANKDVIKLQLYRNCKNIYDKWLGGAKDIDHLVFQCGGRSSVDSALAAKYQNSKTRMIDSFRFVSRSFRDIGDSLYINPIPINNYLIDNPNSSSYDVIGSVLAANNFNFQALPNFINFHSEENLKAIFKPYSYYDETLSGSCGPAFVCVYAGQSSKHLDFREGDYPNDGFDMRCMNGGIDLSVPKDFTSEPYAAYEDPIGTFMVRYSQQNQNIFKDITLDQSEFSETDESIKIQGEIAQKGSENNRAIVGQNIYNVYAVRSYSAQIEMMGNAMIQPMMYFQLDNIPMFHGAYLITNVSHSITPNSMSTNFTGTRIRYPDTPLITAYDVYMDLLETLDISEAGTGQVGGGGGGSTGFDPEFDVIPEKDVAGKFVNPWAGEGKVTSIPGLRTLDGATRTHKGLDIGIGVGTDLIAVYDGEIELLSFNDGGFGAYVVINHGVIGNTTYKTIYGHMSNVDSKVFGFDFDSMSSAQLNKVVAGYNPKIKVKKGQAFGKSGGKGGPYLDKANKKYNTSGHSTGAHLHWELRLGGVKDSGTNVFSLKPVNGLRFIPKGKEYKFDEPTALGGAADYWALVAICTLEAGPDQARADVAQSIYNRLATPNKPYGKSLKEIIVAKGQYEPTFKNTGDWKAIKDKTTAITAVKNSKGWDATTAKSAIEATQKAISSPANQAAAKTFVGTRTEFLAAKPSSSKAQGVVERSPAADNNAFYWQYAGKALISSAPPLPPDLAKYA
jgi:murein DD-endopeptidase MepM/ murein hydrolase activator NlpD